jgi:ABC-type molybdate transport system substrate-binding protein
MRCVVFALMLIEGCVCQAATRGAPALVVFAAASLGDALGQVDELGPGGALRTRDG